MRGGRRWVAIVGQGTGEKAEVVGEDHTGGEDFLREKISWSGWRAEFVPAALGGFDDYLKHAVFLVDGL